MWKDSLFITSVWRFFAANGKSVFIVATDEELHSCRIHNIRIDTTVNSYEGTTRHRAFVYSVLKKNLMDYIRLSAVRE